VSVLRPIVSKAEGGAVRGEGIVKCFDSAEVLPAYETVRSDTELVEQNPSSGGTVQVHLRLLASDAQLLRHLARRRDQTLSAVVRHLLRERCWAHAGSTRKR
jgi:hypothetical protein